ncbi:MAG: MBOAT family O-acyltransferase, partial [Syntrophomonas sp.]
NLAQGVFLFFIGLFKKVVIADAFAVWATHGFDTAPSLSLVEAWVVSLSYTLQLYFDFGGYTDMAIGAALMFNIKLPINFDSPYKSLSIQEFWRRWHITLSRFLRDYIYIPLGGNRNGQFNIYRNTMITFLLGGLWHGAGWTFVFWGFMHGAGLCIQRAWRKLKIEMPNWLAWFITFNFVNIAWIFFRAKTWADAIKVLKGMFGFSGIMLPGTLSAKLGFLTAYGVTFTQLSARFNGIYEAIAMIIVFIIISLTVRNSMAMKDTFRPNWQTALFISILAVWAILGLNKISPFLYFNF